MRGAWEAHGALEALRLLAERDDAALSLGVLRAASGWLPSLSAAECAVALTLLTPLLAARPAPGKLGTQRAALGPLLAVLRAATAANAVAGGSDAADASDGRRPSGVSSGGTATHLVAQAARANLVRTLRSAETALAATAQAAPRNVERDAEDSWQAVSAAHHAVQRSLCSLSTDA